MRVPSSSIPCAIMIGFAMLVAPESRALRIEVLGPHLPQGSATARNAVTVSGQVHSERPLRLLTVGPNELPVPEGDEGVYAFEHRVALERHENIIAITAEDSDGREAREDVFVFADFLLPDHPAFKLPVAVLAAYGPDEALDEPLRARLEVALAQSGRFNLVDEDVLREALTAAEISSDLSNPGHALQLGAVVPAEVFIVAFAREWKDGYTVEARVISTETGTVIGRPDAFFEDLSNIPAVDTGDQALSEQLEALLPRVTGRVIDASDSGIALDFTNADGVRPGMYALIVREGEDAIYDGDRLVLEGTPKLVARVRITQITGEASLATVVAVEDGEAIENGLYAVTW